MTKKNTTKQNLTLKSKHIQQQAAKTNIGVCIKRLLSHWTQIINRMFPRSSETFVCGTKQQATKETQIPMVVSTRGENGQKW